jgi:gluconolactonase
MHRCLFRACIVTLVLVPFVGAFGANEPEAKSVPKGEVIRFTFDKSKVFPGTVRDCWIYVPSQYDPKTPACVYVNQDGIQYNAPRVFDELSLIRSRFRSSSASLSRREG